MSNLIVFKMPVGHTWRAQKVSVSPEATSSLAPVDAKGASFYDLPPEVRNRFYKLCSGISAPVIDVRFQIGSAIYYFLGLTMASRLIRAEFRLNFLENHKFVVFIDDLETFMPLSIRPPPPPRCSTSPEVQIRFISNGSNSVVVVDMNKAWDSRIWDHLNGFSNVLLGGFSIIQIHIDLKATVHWYEEDDVFETVIAESGLKDLLGTAVHMISARDGNRYIGFSFAYGENYA
ncbi:hypothetical protein BDV96DRAFT_676684 [Lophiotrema nucula]|uniref:Uncharacterized protein n=1 Tax=Lophiotrema nucula TaxID=690887 RepID=A0A6A5ZL99_9PLEO|nr:hypothetical protein BDV96DRAFT_676684 [Lophiotrema nucula]